MYGYVITAGAIRSRDCQTTKKKKTTASFQETVNIAMNTAKSNTENGGNAVWMFGEQETKKNRSLKRTDIRSASQPSKRKKTEIDKNKNLVETITLIEPVSSSVRLNFLNDSSSDGWHNKQPQTKNNDDNGNERGNKVELHLMCYSVSHDAVI